MPDARIEPDGTFRWGISNTDPYFSVWTSVSLFPRVEFSGRYITIDRVPGFADAPELGDYRDKAFDAKAVLVEESRWLPAVAVGFQDYVGTQLFAARYLTLGKRFGGLDVTIGYGQDRIDGVFGGFRYRSLTYPNWSFVAEYDRNDYKNDFRSDLSGAAKRAGGATYALEYRNGWFGAQLSRQEEEWAGNLYVSIPLMKREFIPKINEPSPYVGTDHRVSLDDWKVNSLYARRLGRALDEQGFQDVHLRVRGESLEIALSHDRISLIGRAVGRAARTALGLGPSDVADLRITYTQNEQPLLTYVFRDVQLLEKFLRGQSTRAELDKSMDVDFASLDLALQLRDVISIQLESGEIELGADALAPTNGQFMALRRRTNAFSDFSLFPLNLRLFFNDPGEPVRYETFSSLIYSKRVDRGLFLNAAARLTLVENVSDIRQPSTSLLPHVRSDIGDYRRQGDDLRLDSLLMNKYLLIGDRVYGRVSMGYYEEMYAGGGAQVLFVPSRGNWAADIAVDWLRQRAPGVAFGFRDYSVVTSIASLHYRFPENGVTVTSRLGRFLAKDEGMRFELKRRFRSGIEIGAWYTWTNERDITNPGTPDNPYRDKGLFASIPLNSMLTRDTQERASFALADYARDVGQLVRSPGDLYQFVERSLVLDSAEHDPMTGFTR